MSISRNANAKKGIYKVMFSVSPEQTQGAEAVYLLGDFNDWQHAGAEMEALADGGFSTTLELAAGQNYEFRYQTADGRWFNDEAADKYVPSHFPHFHNCLLELAPLEKSDAPKKAKATKTRKKKAPKGDDLRKIEGIGPKIASLLNERGIKSFTDLAEANIATLEEVLADAGPRFRMHKPTTWPQQAQLAADGEWEALKALQDTLKGGR